MVLPLGLFKIAIKGQYLEFSSTAVNSISEIILCVNGK